MLPLVSILIPAYNAESYIVQCLKSIVHQTYQKLQVVVIDDGSTDGTLGILYSFAQNYSFIEIYSQVNSGVAVTRNVLLQHLKGDLVLFVDSDDWLENDTVEFLVNTQRKYDADIVTYGRVDVNLASKSNFKEEIWNKECFIKEFLKHDKLNGSLWSKLIKSSFFECVKFDPQISYGEDALVIWQILQNVENFVWTDKPMYNYRMNDDSISHQSWDPVLKGSDHIVWETISQETKLLWPKFYTIALARFALQDAYALFFACLSNYHFDEHIRKRQINVRDNFKYIIKHKLGGIKFQLVGLLLSHCYFMGFIIRILEKLKK